ncbi:flagellar biosynthesis anti-sigma factor FlgM [Methylomonas sp. AM2-LC]|uniref:flagellar biosynthesis anti-sigma factor FlgM n=1 Tax=Methylomonas sp. AM2-LC TaxID=3153301 RepID=UPI0032646291
MAIESVSGQTPSVSLPAKPVDKDASITNKQPAVSSVLAEAVGVTYTRQDIKNAVASGSSAPVINEDRVAAIKSAIQAGTYQPNAERIASKILQFDHQLSNST